MIEHRVAQGSVAWMKLRNGIPTASEFASIITPKQMKMSEARHAYACRLIAGRLLNWQPDSLDKIEHIADGKAKEPHAIAQLEFTTGLKTRRVGFITTNDGRFGASPDRLVVGANTTVEIKCPTIPKQFEYLLIGHEDAYRCQVQGQIYIGEADDAIWYSYHERTPACHVRTIRDEPFIEKLAAALNQFSDELEAMTEKAKSLGMFQAFAEVAAPLDVEYAEGMSVSELNAAFDAAAKVVGASSEFPPIADTPLDAG